MKKKILVCGASGFIGGNIYRALVKEENLDVSGTYLNNWIWPSKSRKRYKSNLTLKNEVEGLFEINNWDCVIHAAAVTDGYKAVSQNPAKYIADNMVMNTILGEAAYKSKIPHFIFMSCTTVYPHFLNRPVNEGDVVFKKDQLHRSYFGGAWVKLAAENLYQYFSMLNPEFKVTIIRHSNIYGPYDKFDLDRGHVLAATIIKTAKATDTIHMFGTGKEKRDFLFIDDLTRFIKIIVSYPEKMASNFEVYNLGYGLSCSIEHMVDYVKQAANRPELKVCFEGGPLSIDSNLELDISKAGSMGWMPLTDLNKGIKMTYDWYKKNC